MLPTLATLVGASCFRSYHGLSRRIAGGFLGNNRPEISECTAGVLGRERLHTNPAGAERFVRIDADGFVWIIGRLKRFAKVASEMMDPLARIEAAPSGLFGIQLNAVLAASNDDRGEVLASRRRGGWLPNPEARGAACCTETMLPCRQKPASRTILGWLAT